MTDEERAVAMRKMGEAVLAGVDPLVQSIMVEAGEMEALFIAIASAAAVATGLACAAGLERDKALSIITEVFREVWADIEAGK